TLFGLSLLAGLDGVHIDAIGTAIDLRGADFDQFGQTRLEALINGDRNLVPACHKVGCRSNGVQFGSHGSVPSVGSDTDDDSGSADVTCARKIFVPADQCHPKRRACNPYHRANRTASELLPPAFLGTNLLETAPFYFGVDSNQFISTITIKNIVILL